LSNDIAAIKAIDGLESAMKLMPQVDIETNHYFSDGLYARKIIIPEGVTLTGKIHKKETLNILVSGTLLVVSSTGAEKEIIGPSIFVSPPNTKKAGYAVTECIFINVHATEHTDLDKIENEVITENYMKIEGDL